MVGEDSHSLSRSYQGANTLPFVGALMPHFLQQNICVDMQSACSLGTMCVQECVFRDGGGGCDRGFYVLKGLLNYGCECKVWFSLIYRSFWMVYSGITSEIWSYLNYCVKVRLYFKL